ncbi:hypothetical protein Vau01_075740 [Virgisporangium aurantiacum]|uniref:WD40 repeat n=2 Tax=Virgisporangium aurantiacum TaxID=175570 RepID=A0A8J4E3L1_9ACTN|nr:hypothetical protein Vau01_075740 [Virgisporangium aurantiacum]
MQVDPAAVASRPHHDEPHAPAHRRLVADLATALPPTTPEGILAIHGGPAALTSDLTAAVDTDRGLAEILATPFNDEAAPASTVGAPTAAASLLDDVTTIYHAPVVQRLLLRTGGVSEHLHHTRRELDAVHSLLTTATDLEHAASVLDRQKTRLAKAMTLLAHAVPRPPEPDGSPSTTRKRAVMRALRGEGPVEARPRIVQRYAGRVTSVAIAPDGTWLATAADGSAQIWDVATGRPRIELMGHPGRVTSVAIAPDGTWLATADDDGSVKIWDVATGQERTRLMGYTGLMGYTSRVASVAIAPDGTWLATAADESVRTWDVATGQERTRLMGYTGLGYADRVTSVAIAPDGTWLATAGTSVQIWELDEAAPAAMPSQIDVFDSTAELADDAHPAVHAELIDAARHATAQAASLIRECSTDLADLRTNLGTHSAQLGGVSAQESLFQRCRSLCVELIHMSEQLYTALSDFRGADLRAVTLAALEDLDGVRWSEAATDVPATQWPPILRRPVQDHSTPVDDQPGVFEIHVGTAVRLAT